MCFQHYSLSLLKEEVYLLDLLSSILCCFSLWTLERRTVLVGPSLILFLLNSAALLDCMYLLRPTWHGASHILSLLMLSCCTCSSLLTLFLVFLCLQLAFISFLHALLRGPFLPSPCGSSCLLPETISRCVHLRCLPPHAAAYRLPASPSHLCSVHHNSPISAFFATSPAVGAVLHGVFHPLRCCGVRHYPTHRAKAIFCSLLMVDAFWTLCGMGRNGRAWSRNVHACGQTSEGPFRGAGT